MKDNFKIVGGPPLSEDDAKKYGDDILAIGTPLEYLRLEREKRPNLYILTGFSDEKTLRQRGEQLYTANNSGLLQGGLNICNHPGYSLVFDASMIEYLDEEEKSKLIKTWYPVPVKQYSPRIFRYMDEQYVEKFFENGELYLSSFIKFGKHRDENLRDSDEGNIKLTINYGDIKCETSVGYGHNSFVMCGTTVNNITHAKEVFKQSSGFSIENINGFINAVVNAIHSVTDMQVEFVHHGPCMYLLEKEHEVTILDIKEGSFNDFIGIGEKGIDFQRMNNVTAHFAAEHGIFLKQSKYSPEHEYRIIFTIEDNTIPEDLIIKVPEAAKFCKRIDFSL